MNVSVAAGTIACVSIDVIIAMSSIYTRIALTFVYINCEHKQTDNESTDSFGQNFHENKTTDIIGILTLSKEFCDLS